MLLISGDYIAEQGRGNEGYCLADETHLYKGTFSAPGLPMCQRGWNRHFGTSYSIWRNNISESGICPVCLDRAQRGLGGVDCHYPRKLKKLINRDRVPYTPLKPGLLRKADYIIEEALELQYPDDEDV
jgi:hypothetical protein